MPSYLLDLQYRTVLTCRRLVDAADMAEAEMLGNRLVRDVDPTEFDDDPRYPSVTFCAAVVSVDDPMAESLYRRIADDIAVLKDFPGFGDRLRSLLDSGRGVDIDLR